MISRRQPTLLLSTICIPLAKYLLLVFLLMHFYLPASYAHTGKIAKDLLSNKQIKLIDSQAAKAVPACRFIYRQVSIANVRRELIDKCIERWSYWFWSDEKHKGLGQLREKISDFHILDDYLGNKIMPYILKLNKSDQAKFLRKIALYHSDNLIFIQKLINLGIPTKNVLLQQMGNGGGFWVSCDTYRVFLNKNIALYQNQKTLYEPVPDVDARKDIRASYRWEDLHHLTNPTYNICPAAIEQLVQANPDLLNKRQRYNGATPLHLYLAGTFMQNDHDLQLANKLITSVNINIKSNTGNTPLHELLSNTNCTSIANQKN